ncbi:hypothetical protein A2125_00990 [Candidatus Woesebacteria bacterium GWB1_43_5]|uniref:Uncharacterized protein n=1 Tax=Candidatus Woesebacteria bacterium GWB1_43_5 TaxID=1802474 RepID=A0A1F7WSW8_9BACT|nr:MAG: hypothetical protein A2125_00990 [Candidatus Woesebacteria bacterium GWB1_43_5]
MVINLTTTPYTKTGYFNAPGNTNANSVFILGNTGYMTQNNVLRNFDLTNCKQTPEADSCPAIDSDGAAISATGTAVYVVGTYAYVSIAGHVRELEIFDISNPANIVRRGYADVNGEAATDVFMNGDGSRAYIVTNASSSLPEFFIINTSNKTCNDCPDIGTYNAGTSVNLKGVEIVPGARAVVIGVGGEEYQVIDISNETLPIRCGGLQYNAGIYDSASVQEADNDAYTYFVTGDANAEFRIIEGGPGGAVSESGVFTSRVFDAGSDTAFNRFDATFSEPASSDIKFQVGAGDTVGGVCDASGLTFVGPDATSATFFENDGLIPLNDDGLAYENPARCFAYKVFFNSPYATPIFYDITVNYSP